MPTQTTITQALAETKTIAKRIETKSEFITRYLMRPEQNKDPLERQGGSQAAIAAERQAIHDLYERLITIRRAIQDANVANELTIEGTTRSIADWLTWKREVSKKELGLHRLLAQQIERQRAEALRRGGQVVGAVVASAGGDSKPGDIVVNLNEQLLSQDIERLETIAGTLDGLLSLKNATIQVTY